MKIISLKLIVLHSSDRMLVAFEESEA